MYALSSVSPKSMFSIGEPYRMSQSPRLAPLTNRTMIQSCPLVGLRIISPHFSFCLPPQGLCKASQFSKMQRTAPTTKAKAEEEDLPDHATVWTSLLIAGGLNTTRQACY